MKLSDFVAEFLVQQGIRHVFLISGGAIIHCIDSVAQHPELKYICPQHEQGAGAAADAYSRVSDALGTVMVTSGPGATNLITSVCNAYFDSIPALFISGQVAKFRLRSNERLRQKGFQETDVVSIFKPITNYAVQIKNAEDIKYELTQAFYLAKSGRPGPVLIDIPDDIQRVEIEPNALREFIPPASTVSPQLPSQTLQLFQLIQSAQRPVLIFGAGVRITRQEKEAIALARYFQCPVLLTWGGMDLFPYDDKLNMGGVGVCGPRGGNFAVQNSDLVIAIGTRLSQQITGGKQNLFATKAKKVMVDIDREELGKFSENDLHLDLVIHSDLRDFFKQCHAYYGATPADQFVDWRRQIQAWRRQYPICPAENHQKKENIDVYVFMKELSRAAKEGDIIITDAGGNLSWTMQGFEIKKDQRVFSAWNHSPMGYSLPASIGAALAGQRDIICIIGDGGLMMCLSELATIKRYDLPVKVFVINNHGHGIQKQTLDNWMNSRYVAVDEATGLAFPDFIKAGELFKFTTFYVDSHRDLPGILKTALATRGPVLCNVEIDPNQKILPMLQFGAGLEDLAPALPREEIRQIMEASETSDFKV